MSAENGPIGESRKWPRFREFLNYTVGGILAWGLIGWILDYLLDTRWIWIFGAILGAGAGYYLAHQHRKARTSGSDPGEQHTSP
ncbi:AtpZ/AtpI family protein [Arthrobacter sp. KK5.5]|uniref:AtpZ/AtpI family protein n=1 Tax=Arthrobacter sp. KK5.5 TaxID=3373084 RepID=UPI003EE5EF3A